jgi:hypothetical protein
MSERLCQTAPLPTPCVALPAAPPPRHAIGVSLSVPLCFGSEYADLLVNLLKVTG